MIDGCPLSLREIIVIDNRFAARKVDVGGNSKLERDIDSVSLAQSFLQEVVLKRLG
jgi:hypothetical protein